VTAWLLSRASAHRFNDNPGLSICVPAPTLWHSAGFRATLSQRHNRPACPYDNPEVHMTTGASGRDAFDQLLPALLADLSAELTAEERYRRLLAALRRIVPCDACALLRLQGEQLQPVAVMGLSEDALGRRFALADQPRLARILLS